MLSFSCPAAYLGTLPVLEDKLSGDGLAETVQSLANQTLGSAEWQVTVNSEGFYAKHESGGYHFSLDSLLVCHLLFEKPRVVVWVVRSTEQHRMEASVWKCESKDAAVELFHVFHELSGKLKLEKLGLTNRVKKKHNASEAKENGDPEETPKPPPRLKKKKQSASSKTPQGAHSPVDKSSLDANREKLLDGVSEDKKSLILKLLTPAGGRPTRIQPNPETRQRIPAQQPPPPPPKVHLPPPEEQPHPPASAKNKQQSSHSRSVRTVVTGGRRIVLSGPLPKPHPPTFQSSSRPILSVLPVSYNNWVEKSGSGDPVVHTGAVRRMFGGNPSASLSSSHRSPSSSSSSGVTRKSSFNKPKPPGLAHSNIQSRLSRSYNHQVPRLPGPKSQAILRSGSLSSQGSVSSDSGLETVFPKSVLKKSKRPSTTSSNNNSRRPPQKKNVTFNAFTRVQVMEE